MEIHVPSSLFLTAKESVLQAISNTIIQLANLQCHKFYPTFYRFTVVEDVNGAEPAPQESTQCCLITATEERSFYTKCRDSNGYLYSYTETLEVPSSC